MRKLTVHVHLTFNDMAAEDTDAAAEAVKSALVTMHQSCQSEFAAALESIGATDVEMKTVVF